MNGNNEGMTIRELQYRIQELIDEVGVSDQAKVHIGIYGGGVIELFAEEQMANGVRNITSVGRL